MMYGELMLGEIAKLLHHLGGPNAVRAMLRHMPKLAEDQQPLKHSHITWGQVEVFLNLLAKVGDGHTLQAILAGELEFVVREANPTLVDVNGRAIPFCDIVVGTVDANRDCRIDSFGMDYTYRLGRITQVLTAGQPFITPGEFYLRAQAILERVRGNRRVANLLKRPYLAWALPQTVVNDLGTYVESLATAAGQAYEQQFPRRKFNNYRKGSLAGQVGIVPGTRHEQMVAALANGPVVGVTFPTALQGFSIPAGRAVVGRLPTEFILSGLDTLACMIGYPDVLARDWNTPGYDQAAFHLGSAVLSLGFKANDDSLDFGERGFDASGDYSGGLVVIAP